MSHVPGGIETDYQPPMELPLVHVAVGAVYLLLGVLVGLADALETAPGLASLAHVHLLVLGWVCVTIMGAMTQFVPVWSGGRLHSHRLAAAQLWLVGSGLIAFVAALLAGELQLLALAGSAMALGFWLFVYNIARSLPSVGELDVTERHFAWALGYFTLVPLLGLLLAADLGTPFLDGGSGLFGGDIRLTHGSVLAAHATLAVFGAVLTTVLGALYQLATVFTQTTLHGVDHSLRRIEEGCYPAGVVLLGLGRFVGLLWLARTGAILILAGLAAFGIILARRLWESRVDATPMLTRYGVATVALFAWLGLTAPVWLADPLAPTALFGASPHLLLVGVVAFVVLGSLYHVVPFIVWVHRYSDELGYEPVPMIDDLYEGRLAALDFWAWTLGGAALVWASVGGPMITLPIGGALLTVGVVLVLVNGALLLARHGGSAIRSAVIGWLPGLLERGM